MHQEGYAQMMSQMLNLFLPTNHGTCEAPQTDFGRDMASRMMQNQSFVDSLRFSHNSRIFSQSDPLVSSNINILDCPVFSIG